MKILLVLILIILGLVAYVLFGPESSTSTDTDKAAAGNHPAMQSPVQGAGSASTQAGQQKVSGGSGSTGGIASDIGDVVNYGIGATQLKIKKNSERKLDDINAQHNKELNDRLAKP